MLAFPIIGLVKPVAILKWAKQAHPGLREDDETALSFIRLICAGALLIGIYFAVLVVRSLFSN
jgi:hypothetical protein